nr:glycine transferase [Cytophagales bacterium]
MQPYFFPYLGYFSLIDAVDQFVFFDTVQFVRKSWMSRNRMLKPSLEDFQFIHAGLGSPDYRCAISACQMAKGQEWQEQLLRQLEHYKKSAPHYAVTIDLLKDIFNNSPEFLSQFNAYSTCRICDYLGIEKEFSMFSEVTQTFPEAGHPGEWGLIISKVYGAAYYINAPGGEVFYKPEEFQDGGVHLGFIHPSIKEYRQGFSKTFLPGLSILDVLMYNDIEGINQMIKSYTVDWKN